MAKAFSNVNLLHYIKEMKWKVINSLAIKRAQKGLNIV